jgi:hypothetical protein
VTLTVIGGGNADEDMLRRTETDRLLDELSQLNFMASYVIGVESKQENKMVEFHFNCATCPLLEAVM